MSRYNARVDYYSILGIAPHATTTEVKAAYNSLAKKHHPDVNPLGRTADKEAFNRITEAKTVLANEKVRMHYDMERNEGWTNIRKDGRGGAGTYDKAQYKPGFEPGRRSRSGTPKHFLLVEKVLKPRFLFLGLPLVLMGYGFLKSKTKEVRECEERSARRCFVHKLFAACTPHPSRPDSLTAPPAQIKNDVMGEGKATPNLSMVEVRVCLRS